MWCVLKNPSEILQEWCIRYEKQPDILTIEYAYMYHLTLVKLLFDKSEKSELLKWDACIT